MKDQSIYNDQEILGLVVDVFYTNKKGMLLREKIDNALSSEKIVTDPFSDKEVSQSYAQSCYMQGRHDLWRSITKLAKLEYERILEL